MKTIEVVLSRYINGNDQVIGRVYRASRYEIREETKTPILMVYSGDDLIASHKSWDHVRFIDRDNEIEEIIY